MKKLGLHELREYYLDFFKSKDHLVVPSYSLVPKNDKSLLLIGAGMAPLKKYFTGELEPPKSRMASSQKCIRTGDLENVGITDRHATFFEMLGNFSFGDYFKKESIAWAWEFLTEWLEIPEENLWATVYLEDDEAYDIWHDEIGVPKEKIVKLGKEDNFWELQVGPSGPCSEIYIDRGLKHGCGDPDCKPGCECDRFMEVWNLVFTQFDKDEAGVYHPLAHPNIDTGMGLERMAAILEEANNIFEIEAIQEIIEKIEEETNYQYGKDKKLDISVRVITDHIRGATFLASDGVLPSNEGRGYVMRRIIRRAARHGKLLGVKGTFLEEVSKVVINSWSVAYPELKDKETAILEIIHNEEDKFQETIDSGMDILNEYITKMESEGVNTLSGEQAFKLYDTYGFPLDITKEILAEKGLTVDEKGYDEHMQQQRDRARAARDDSDDIGWSSQSSHDLIDEHENIFVGYERLEERSKVLMLLQDGETVDHLEQDESGIVVLSSTAFYGESGGQIGDTGFLSSDSVEVEVLDTKKTPHDNVYHVVKVIRGKLSAGDEVLGQVQSSRRGAIMRNHSATHLLHQALKDVLGDHVNQAGSEVGDESARFDFTHYEAMTDEQLDAVEKKVNEKILQSLPVEISEMSLPEAESKGAIGLFEAKYGEVVRVIEMGNYSIELCGGTHVNNTAQIGAFKIISESSVASGVRRVEYMTSMSILNLAKSLEAERAQIAQVLKTAPLEIEQKALTLQEELKAAQKEIQELKHEKAAESGATVLNNIQEVNGIKFIVGELEGVEGNDLRDLADKAKDKMGTGVVVLASKSNDKLTFVAGVTKDLVKSGFHAGNLVKVVAQKTGGNGGGRPDMAMAGGKDASKIEEALAEVKTYIENQGE